MRKLTSLCCQRKELPLHIFSEDHEFLQVRAEAMRSMISRVRKVGAYPRGDYKERLDLIEVILGQKEPGYVFQRPGAVDKSRWMGMQLYCYKLVLLQDHLSPGIVSKSQISKMERLVKFTAFVFNEWWFNFPVATSAPRQDLELLLNCRKYKDVDEGVACSVEKALKRHTWYLTGEMVPLALWDEDLADTERTSLVNAILCLPETSSFTLRFGNGWGKPDLANVDITKTHLSEYVTSDSSMFFHVMGLSKEFLPLPVNKWKEDTGYRAGAAILKEFKVTNDGAERAVKLVAEFLGLSKKEEVLQNYLQIVEKNRADMPNLRARKKARSSSCSL